MEKRLGIERIKENIEIQSMAIDYYVWVRYYEEKFQGSENREKIKTFFLTSLTQNALIQELAAPAAMETKPRSRS